MTEKECLQCVLQGKIPEKVPHFELDFQISKEVFGTELPSVYKFSEEQVAPFRSAYLQGWGKDRRPVSLGCGPGQLRPHDPRDEAPF